MIIVAVVSDVVAKGNVFKGAIMTVSTMPISVDVASFVTIGRARCSNGVTLVCVVVGMGVVAMVQV